MSKVIVIGGGAAGMMAAISAADSGADVLLIEKNEKLGKKVYITGKGRCNVTNDSDVENHLKHVVSNPKFLYSAFYTFDSGAMMDFLASEGLVLKTERGNRVFPESDKSSDVLRTLKKALEKRNVEIKYNIRVTDIEVKSFDNYNEADGKSSRRIQGVTIALPDGRLPPAPLSLPPGDSHIHPRALRVMDINLPKSLVTE